MLEETWVKRQAIPPSSSQLHSFPACSVLLTRLFIVPMVFFLSPRVAAHLHAGNCCCYSRTANFASFQLLLFTHEPRKSRSFLTGSDYFSHAQEILGFPTIVGCVFFPDLGLLFSLCFAGCGVQFRFVPLWVSNSWAEFLYFRTVHSCHGFYFEIGLLLLFPWFGMLWLSCFGHVRAKTNSGLSLGLELCSSIVWGCPLLFMTSSQSCEGNCFAAGMQWFVPWTMLAWLVC